MTLTASSDMALTATPAPALTITAGDRRQTISALPAAVDLDLYRGDDFTLTVTVTNPDGTPADLTGATVAAQIRTTPDDTTIAGSFTASIAANVITLQLTHTVSATLPAGGAWDVQVTQTSRLTTLMGGRVTVTPDVTRP